MPCTCTCILDVKLFKWENVGYQSIIDIHNLFLIITNTNFQFLLVTTFHINLTGKFNNLVTIFGLYIIDIQFIMDCILYTFMNGIVSVT